MREIVFRLLEERPGRLEACSDDRRFRIAAASLEELHHEAREALIAQLGPSHATYRVRILRGAAASNVIQPLCRPLPPTLRQG
ncbi:MAG: hypothetical protein VKK62_09255 [Synechococcaceae cyanobacterium]|nr:hypothetical protein [Synechococcaceae cyanobacterium]